MDDLNDFKCFFDDNDDEDEDEETAETNEEAESSNAFNIYQPSFAEGGPPTLVKLPTNVPLYPNYGSFAYMKQNLPADAKVDYYEQLLGVIQEMRSEIRPTYAGNKNSSDRLKRCLTQARILIAECASKCMENQRESPTSSSESPPRISPPIQRGPTPPPPPPPPPPPAPPLHLSFRPYEM